MSYSYHLLACTYVYMHFCGTVCGNVKMCMLVNLIDLRVECV